jgi:hypothetical protein
MSKNMDSGSKDCRNDELGVAPKWPQSFHVMPEVLPRHAGGLFIRHPVGCPAPGKWIPAQNTAGMTAGGGANRHLRWREHRFSRSQERAMPAMETAAMPKVRAQPAPTTLPAHPDRQRPRAGCGPPAATRRRSFCINHRAYKDHRENI